jgi:DNA polymerase I
MKTLLDADYVTRDNKAVIRLFYKTDGARTIEEVTDFDPYFYAVPEGDIDDLIKDLKNVPHVVRTVKKRMIYIGKEIDVLQIIVQEPGNVPEIRSQVRELEHCGGVKEASIPFTERYIIDSGRIPMQDADFANLRIAAVDTEVYNPHGMPEADKDPIIMISYADNLGLKKVWSYRHTTVPDFVEVLKDEKEMIKKFVETIKAQEIDLIVSYNGDNFDFPYLKDRAAKYKFEMELGIDGSTIKMERRGMNNGARVKGRPHVDLYPPCRQVFNISRYTLEDIYKELFGVEKLDVEVEHMASIWDGKEGQPKLNELYEYSLSDAEATLRIAIALLPLQYELSRITGQPIYECSRSTSGQRVEDLLVKTAHEKNILVPNRPSDRIAEERTRNPYEGAYVVEPEKGIHDNIALFDFRSLYPSIIISHNIDQATVDCKCCPGKEEHHQSPTGHFFCKKQRGFLPDTLEILVKRRMEVKKEAKAENDPEKKKLLDVKQQALKILANSMYGYFGFARARWYSREGAEAIAAYGREYIHKTIEEAKHQGFKVVYGDTDSVYITKPSETDQKKLMEDAKAFAKTINSQLPEAMELEFQGFYPRGIFITKKRYAVMDDKGNLTVKGLETKRRDWSEIAKKTQTDVLNALLQDKDPQKAADIVKEAVKKIKTGNVPLSDLSINTQITRGMGEYVNEGPHVLAAKKAMKEHGYEYKQGTIMTYVITKKGTSISDKARIMEDVVDGDYDQEYYIDNQVIPAVARILESLGYTEDELKGKGKQKTLFDY